jgi:hypothetical protein
LLYFLTYLKKNPNARLTPTIDTSTLLFKLQHYGIHDRELKLMTSYLTKRQQLVQIDTFRSDTIPTPDCSCIQGSKMSSILYTLYTNEIPLLPTLMTQ